MLIAREAKKIVLLACALERMSVRALRVSDFLLGVVRLVVRAVPTFKFAEVDVVGVALEHAADDLVHADAVPRLGSPDEIVVADVQLFPEAVMIALPADHVVHGAALVAKAVRTAVTAASTSDSLVTVGLKPTFPSTGLGYIHAPGRVSRGTLRVRRFIEKPNAASARRFVREGGYYWNLAWFSWRLSTFLDELGRHAPRHLAGLRRVIAARSSGDEVTASRLYSRLPVEVIDRSVMEKTDRLLLVPAAFDWADIGNWAELGDLVHADARGNSIEGDVLLIDTAGSMVFGDRRLIATIGLDRSKAYIANVIPWRPPGNRTPTPQETQICLPFIQRQIELVNPDILVTLGNPSTQTLLSTREGIMRTRGRWFDYDTGTRIIRAMATFHPAYLLRSPSYKRMAWQDLRAIAKALEQGGSPST